MKTKSAFYAQWGLILGGGIVALKWITQSIGVGPGLATIFVGLHYVIFACILYFTIRKYKYDYLNEYPTFGQLFKCGFRSVLYASIVVGIMMFVYFGYIIDKSTLYAVQESAYNIIAPMITSENEESIEHTLQLMIDPYYLGVSSAVVFILDGAFITLIVSLSMRRKNPNPFAGVE